MKPIIGFAVVSKTFTKHGNGLMKLEYDIKSTADALVYVQVHDWPTTADLLAGRTAPAAGTVPLKSWPALAGAQQQYKEFKNGEMTLSNGCFVCVSTTQATLTIGTGNNKFDSVAAEFIEPDIASSTTEVQTTANAAVSPFQVFADGSAVGSKLLRAIFQNNIAAIVYLQLFAIDAPVTATSIPLDVWALAATGDSGGKDILTMDFGMRGAPGRSVHSEDSDGTKHTGCTFAISSTPNIYTAIGAGTYGCYAEYM